jgi:hypothetical protein
LPCFLNNTGGAPAGVLRPGNAAADTTADHIHVLDAAPARIPDAHRHGTQILGRADRPGRPRGAAGGHSDHRPPRTTAPRRSAVPVRPGRGHAPPGLPHRHPDGRGPCNCWRSATRARPHRGPHPLRQDHRNGPGRRVGPSVCPATHPGQESVTSAINPVQSNPTERRRLEIQRFYRWDSDALYCDVLSPRGCGRRPSPTVPRCVLDGSYAFLIGCAQVH